LEVLLKNTEKTYFGVKIRKRGPKGGRSREENGLDGRLKLSGIYWPIEVIRRREEGGNHQLFKIKNVGF